MDTGDVGVLSRHPVPRNRLSVAEYRRLGEAGILGEDDRVELLEGQLVAMSPIGSRHALAVDMLMNLLIPAVAGQASARVQNPVTLDGATEPQPDIAVVRRAWAGYPGAHPGPADIFLLVEVADASLETDTGAKLELYAWAGIGEYWVVDLVNDCVRVHRQPAGGTYTTIAKVEPSEILDVAALPGVAIPASALFF